MKDITSTYLNSDLFEKLINLYANKLINLDPFKEIWKTVETLNSEKRKESLIKIAEEATFWEQMELDINKELNAVPTLKLPSTLDENEKILRDLWNNSEINKLNVFLANMEKQQGNTPINVQVKCKGEIEQYELLVSLKQDQHNKAKAPKVN